MKRAAWVVLPVLLSLARLASAAAPDPFNQALWNYVTATSSITGVASATIDIAGAANGNPTKGHEATLKSYSVLSVGGNAVFTISETTGTYSSLAQVTTGYNNPSVFNFSNVTPTISTSAPNFAPNGVSVSDEQWGYGLNPIFNFTSLSPAATTYLWVTYGVPR